MEIDALVVIGLLLGGLSLLGRDCLGKVTRFGNDLDGVASQRTAMGNAGTIVSGVVAMMLGGVIVIPELIGSSLRAYSTSRAYTGSTNAVVDQAIRDVLGNDLHNHLDQRYFLIPDKQGDVTATLLQIQRHYAGLWRMRC